MRKARYTKVPTILQMEATECGAASLGMILAFYGCFLPLELLRVETDVSRDGVNAKNISKAAKKYGLKCQGYFKDVKSLLSLPVPSILHWNACHFVVFEGIKQGYAYINDPAFGRRRLTFKELEEGFSNVVLTFEREKGFKKSKQKHVSSISFASRLNGYLGVIFKLFFSGLLLVFPGIVLSVLSQIFMDDVLGNGYTDWVIRIIVFMGCTLLLKLCLSFYRLVLLKKFESQLIIRTDISFLQHLFQLPISFFEQRYSGELVSRVDNDAEISEFLAGDLIKIFLNMITALIYLFILFLYNPILMAIGLIGVGLSMVVMLLAGRYTTNETIKLQMYEGKLAGAVCAGLNIADTIKAAGIETNYSRRLLGHQAKAAVQEQKLARFQHSLSVLPDMLGSVSDVLILLVGGYMVIYGHMTLGMLLAFNTIFDLFCDPAEELVSIFSGIQKMKANINRVADVFRYPTAVVSSSNSEKWTGNKLEGNVRLETISFGYSRMKPAIIHEVSLSIRAGDSFALVGASGCGKSTIAKIISGLYRQWSGRLLFDEKPVEFISQHQLHASVSVVSQNISLFSGTVRDNITLWNEHILEEDVVRAAKDACLHEFIINQPNGYDMRIDENASNLSGGQRQRLEIARALATNPSILIMDEATSALDPLTEKRIMDNIRRRACTCIIVAHRLSAIRDCSRIAVIDEGKIVQIGSHDELFQQDGPYRAFVRTM